MTEYILLERILPLFSLVINVRQTMFEDLLIYKYMYIFVFYLYTVCLICIYLFFIYIQCVHV